MSTFTCECCTKSYSNLGNLNKHKKKCKGKKPDLTCCDITFPTPSKYEEHLLTKRHIMGVTGFEAIYDKFLSYQKKKGELIRHNRAYKTKVRDEESGLAAYDKKYPILDYLLDDEKLEKLNQDIESMRKELESYKLVTCNKEQWGNLSKQIVNTYMGDNWYEVEPTQKIINYHIFN